MIQNLEDPAVQASLSPKRSKSKWGRNPWVFAGVLLSFAVAGGLVGLIFHVHFSILEELRNERSSRLISDERNAKITEKLTDKIIADASQVQMSAISSLIQASQDQSTSIQRLNNLVEKLLMEKKRWQKEKISRKEVRRDEDSR